MARKQRSGVVRPHWLWFVVLDGGIFVLVQFVRNPALYATARQRTADRLPPHGTIKALLAGTAVIHVAEAAAAGHMAARRGLPKRGWILQTFLVGFPSLLKLREV